MFEKHAHVIDLRDLRMCPRVSPFRVYSSKQLGDLLGVNTLSARWSDQSLPLEPEKTPRNTLPRRQHLR